MLANTATVHPNPKTLMRCTGYAQENAARNKILTRLERFRGNFERIKWMRARWNAATGTAFGGRLATDQRAIRWELSEPREC